MLRIFAMTSHCLRRYAGVLVATLLLTPALGQAPGVPWGQIGTWTNPNGGFYEFIGGLYRWTPPDPKLDLQNGHPLTLEAWVFRTSEEIPQHVAGKRDGCSESRGFYQIAIDRNDPGTGMSVDPQFVPVNVWTHLAIVIDKLGWSVYANGERVKTVHSPDWPIQNPGTFAIGSAGKCKAFVGKIAEVSLYGRLLSPNEIHALAMAGVPAMSQDKTPQRACQAEPKCGQFLNEISTTTSATDVENFRQDCAEGLMPKTIENTRNSGSVMPEAIDVCIAVLTRTAHDGELLTPYLQGRTEAEAESFINEDTYIARQEPEPFKPLGDIEKMWAAGLLVPSHIFDLGFTKAYRTKFAMNFDGTDMAKIKRDASQCLEEKSSNRDCAALGYIEGAYAYRRSSK